MFESLILFSLLLIDDGRLLYVVGDLDMRSGASIRDEEGDNGGDGLFCGGEGDSNLAFRTAISRRRWAAITVVAGLPEMVLERALMALILGLSLALVSVLKFLSESSSLPDSLNRMDAILTH